MLRKDARGYIPVVGSPVVGHACLIQPLRCVHLAEDPEEAVVKGAEVHEETTVREAGDSGVGRMAVDCVRNQVGVDPGGQPPGRVPCQSKPCNRKGAHSRATVPNNSSNTANDHVGGGTQRAVLDEVLLTHGLKVEGWDDGSREEQFF
jgi:hypothetical protein